MTEPTRDALAREAQHVRRLGWTLSFLTAMLLVVLTLYSWPFIRSRLFTTDGMRTITPRGPLLAFENVTIDVARKASPSVVYITTTRRIINRRVLEVQEGSGSGFIWDELGHVVTNYHVIQTASAAQVVLSDQTTYDAQVVGASPDHDLAVLKINVPLGVRLIPIQMGTSNDLQVGQAAFAIGNPFGLDQTVTTGIVSAVRRSIPGISGTPIEDVIQTDAAINPGNSGGPLLDSAARLIGVNTAIFSPNGGWMGIGFAVPVDTANRVVPQIITTGKYQRARLGIVFDDSLQSRSRQILAASGMQGLAIEYVEPGSPADKAGIHGMPMAMTSRRGGRGPLSLLGDVITHINGRAIKSSTDLYSIMDRTTPGDTVEVTLWNSGEVRQVKVVTQ